MKPSITPMAQFHAQSAAAATPSSPIGNEGSPVDLAPALRAIGIQLPANLSIHLPAGSQTLRYAQAFIEHLRDANLGNISPHPQRRREAMQGMLVLAMHGLPADHMPSSRHFVIDALDALGANCPAQYRALLEQTPADEPIKNMRPWFFLPSPGKSVGHCSSAANLPLLPFCQALEHDLMACFDSNTQQVLLINPWARNKDRVIVDTFNDFDTWLTHAQHHAQTRQQAQGNTLQIPESGSHAYQLLYCDDEGEEVGLDEIYLLDPISAERLAATQSLLSDDNPLIRFQAALILTAWGNDAGLDALETMIRQGGRDGCTLSPDRLTGEDNRFDDMATPIHYYAFFSDGDKSRTLHALGELLNIYPDHSFKSGLKYVLPFYPEPEISGKVSEAIRQCQKNGRTYQASQLLPVLAKRAPQTCWQLLPLFTEQPPQVPDPAANIAEALAYIHTPESDAMLQRYLTSTSPGVADAARQAIAMRT